MDNQNAHGRFCNLPMYVTVKPSENLKNKIIDLRDIEPSVPIIVDHDREAFSNSEFLTKGLEALNNAR